MEIKSKKRAELIDQEKQLLIGAGSDEEQIMKAFHFGTINKVHDIKREQILFEEMSKSHWGLDVLNLEDIMLLTYETGLTLIPTSDYVDSIPKKVTNSILSFIDTINSTSKEKFSPDYFRHYLLVNAKGKIRGVLSSINDRSLPDGEQMFIVVADFTKSYLKPIRKIRNLVFHSHTAVSILLTGIPLAIIVNFVLGSILNWYGDIGFYIMYPLIVIISTIIHYASDDFHESDNNPDIANCKSYALGGFFLTSVFKFKNFLSSISCMKTSVINVKNDDSKRKYKNIIENKYGVRMILKSLLSSIIALSISLIFLINNDIRRNIFMGIRTERYNYSQDKDQVNLIEYKRDGFHIEKIESRMHIKDFKDKYKKD